MAIDNLSSHGGPRVREFVEAPGCELAYLPAYSPDLNPIEQAFAKVKALLRRAGARTREALLEAMDRALDAVTADDARGPFKHRGYRLVLAGQAQRRVPYGRYAATPFCNFGLGDVCTNTPQHAHGSSRTKGWRPTA